MNNKLMIQTVVFGLLLVAGPICAQVKPTTTVAASAPTPNPAGPNARQQAILDKSKDVETRLELMYEKLHGLSEFQEYLQLRDQMEQLRQQYQQAAMPQPKAVAPEVKK